MWRHILPYDMVRRCPPLNIWALANLKAVPSPPHSLFDRIRFIEEHLAQLEREYPPWAALHFNQPRRGVSPDEHTFPFYQYSHGF